MEIEPISSKPVSLPHAPTSISQRTPQQMHNSSLQSLSIHQKEPSTFFTCIKRFFEFLCIPFVWLYNLLSPSPHTKTPQVTATVPTTAQTVPQEIAPKEKEGSYPHYSVCSVEEVIDPYAYDHRIRHHNKRAAYQHLTLKNTLANHKPLALNPKPISFYKYTMHDRSFLRACPLFHMSSKKGNVYCEDGLIPYGHNFWVANFADQNIMGYCEGARFTQDEAQVVVHPHLYHVKTALQEKGHHYMEDNEIFLLTNVPCLGRFDNYNALYGNKFAQATEKEIKDRLFFDALMGNSNIFFIAAPHIAPDLAYKPYQKAHLEQLFYTAYTAFFGINEQSPDQSDVSTGNWGAGAFGNSAKVTHLIQLAAARAAGVNIFFYPLDKKADFNAAKALFDKIEKQHPDMSIDQFLTHLAENANEYKLFYGIGNGT